LNIQVSREHLLKQLGYKEPPQPNLLGMVDQMLGLLDDLVEPGWPSEKSKTKKTFRLFSQDRL